MSGIEHTLSLSKVDFKGIHSHALPLCAIKFTQNSKQKIDKYKLTITKYKAILNCCARLILSEHSVNTGNSWQHILCC